MAQFLRPDSDISNPGTWSGSYTAIDEVTASDTDFIISDVGGTIGYVEIGVSNPGSTPSSGTVTVRWRGRRNKTNKNCTVVCRVFEGTTELATQTQANPSDVYATWSFTFSTSLVTDWTNLRFRFDQTVHGGGGVGFEVSWAEIETPDGASTPVSNTQAAVAEALEGSGASTQASGAESLEIASTSLLANAESKGPVATTESSVAESIEGVLETQSGPAESIEVIGGSLVSGAESLESVSAEILAPAESLGATPVSNSLEVEAESLVLLTTEETNVAESLAEAPAGAVSNSQACVAASTRIVTYRFDFADGKTPDYPDARHTWKIRRSLVGATGEGILFRARLIAGTAEVLEIEEDASSIPSSPTTLSRDLTAPEKTSLVGKYTSLRGEFEVEHIGGGTEREVRVTWTELEIPYGESFANVVSRVATGYAESRGPTSASLAVPGESLAEGTTSLEAPAESVRLLAVENAPPVSAGGTATGVEGGIAESLETVEATDDGLAEAGQGIRASGEDIAESVQEVRETASPNVVTGGTATGVLEGFAESIEGVATTGDSAAESIESLLVSGLVPVESIGYVVRAVPSEAEGVKYVSVEATGIAINKGILVEATLVGLAEAAGTLGVSQAGLAEAINAALATLESGAESVVLVSAEETGIAATVLGVGQPRRLHTADLEIPDPATGAVSIAGAATGTATIPGADSRDLVLFRTVEGSIAIVRIHSDEIE